MLTKMRLLLIASFPDSVLAFRGDLLDSFTQRGFQVHVAAPGLERGSAHRSQLEARGFATHDIRLDRTSTNPAGDAVTLVALYSLIRRIRPNVMLAYTAKPVIYGSIAAWLCRIPRRFALITGLGHAFQDETAKSTQRVVKWLYRLALARVHKVFFQNPDDEALFRHAALLASRTPSCVVNGSGVDVDRFSAAPVPGGPAHFLLIARLLGEKGVREYVDAARTVRRVFPQVTFSIAGWLDSNPSSIGTSELNGWVTEGVIAYLGRVDDVRPAIRNCTVYVLPSYREGTPRTVLEAMAIGRAIVTTDAPGCRETVLAGENGFLVQPRSVSSLESALLRFAADPSLALRMGRRSRQIAEAKYDVRRVNETIIREMGFS